MPDQQPILQVHAMGRRAFLHGGAVFLAGSALLPTDRLLAAQEEKPTLRLALVTDLHHSNKERRGNRYYNETLTKFAEAASYFREQKPQIVVELGDLIDSGTTLDDENDYLKRIVREFSAVPGKHHYVVGNHCVRNLTKSEFLEAVGQERTYYSFDAAEYHFVVLDPCFCYDGTPHGRLTDRWPDASVPPSEMSWLREDLRKTDRKTIVFIHQCLDLGYALGVTNGVQVRKILEESGKVLAVVQGHYHHGYYQEIGHIHYCTMSAMIEGSGPENNSYAIMDMLPGDVIRFRGFRKQKSYRFNSVC